MLIHTRIYLCLAITLLVACSSEKCISQTNNPIGMNSQSRKITGALSGKTINLLEVNASSANSILASQFVLNGEPLTGFAFETNKPFPDGKSFKRKFGLLIPATNTSMEYELWSIIFNNQESLEGIGLHTSNIYTKKFYAVKCYNKYGHVIQMFIYRDPINMFMYHERVENQVVNQ